MRFIAARKVLDASDDFIRGKNVRKDDVLTDTRLKDDLRKLHIAR
jgi:hypothetical protein